MAAEARKAYQEYMSGAAGSNNAQQQPGANLQNLYGGFAAHMQQVPQGMQNLYAGQPYPPFNPVSQAVRFPFPFPFPFPFHPPYTYPMDLSKLSTALVPARRTDEQQLAQAQVPPAAPTPPPAVPPAPTSNAALAQYSQLQPYTPQGPSIPPHARSSGYAALPRSYNPPQQSPLSGYNPGWQYNQPAPPQNQVSFSSTPAMAPAQADPACQPGDWSFESTRDRNRLRYTGAWPPPDVVKIPTPPPANNVVPVPDVPPLALCHVCSVCGQMRSTGYHRHHPIIPGQALISNPCRRCKKRARKQKERREKEKARQEEARQEEARQEEARDSSERIITIRIDDSEGRGRTRGRKAYEVHRHHSLSPARVVYKSRSHANVELGGSTRIEYRTTRESSLERSPPPTLRHRTRSEVRFPSSNPPSNSVGVHYQCDEGFERPRSPSPDARARLASHPTPFRTFTPTFHPPGHYPAEPASPAHALPRGILKAPSQFYEYPTRHTMEASYDSMVPEVGGNRVQFGREPRQTEHVREHHTRCVTCKGNECTCDDDHAHRHHRQHHYQRGFVEEIPSPEPVIKRFERLHVQEKSPPSAHIRDRSHPRRRELDEVYFRHVHVDTAHDIPDRREYASRQLPPILDERGCTRYPRAESRREQSPLRKTPSYLRELGQKVRRSFSRTPTPPPNRKYEDWDDATDSGSEASGEHYLVRYRDVDENGRPAPFIEECVKKPLRVIDSVHNMPEGAAFTRGFAPVRHH